jgi:predicted kinase
MVGPIYVVSGVPGAGKSTVSWALCSRYARALLVSGDDLRDMVVSGFASALEPWTDEHSRQFSLSWRTAASIAAKYADAGFAVVIDDVVREDDLRRDFVPELGKRPLRRVLLKPSLDVAITRNRGRTNKTFDLERLVPIITRLYESLAEHTEGWVVVDTTALTTEQTADVILRSVGGV